MTSPARRPAAARGDGFAGDELDAQPLGKAARAPPPPLSPSARGAPRGVPPPDAGSWPPRRLGGAGRAVPTATVVSPIPGGPTAHSAPSSRRPGGDPSLCCPDPHPGPGWHPALRALTWLGVTRSARRPHGVEVRLPATAVGVSWRVLTGCPDTDVDGQLPPAGAVPRGCPWPPLARSPSQHGAEVPAPLGREGWPPCLPRWPWLSPAPRPVGGRSQSARLQEQGTRTLSPVGAGLPQRRSPAIPQAPLPPVR